MTCCGFYGNAGSALLGDSVRGTNDDAPLAVTRDGASFQRDLTECKPNPTTKLFPTG
jgi:hypothetical protein